MTLKLFLQKTSDLFAENRLLKFVIIVIGVATLLNSFMSYRALNYQRVVLVPPNLDRRVQVEGNRVDEAYIRVFTRYVSNLFLNYNASTCRQQLNELLSMYTPEGFPKAKEMFYQLADKVEAAKAGSVFYLQKVDIDERTSTITVQGQRKQVVEKSVLDEGTRAYSIVYRIIDGRFAINEITEVSNSNSGQ